MTSNDSLPVLIVGGGPVGLALATDLGWRGIPCLLIERRDGTVNHPKMNMVSARTMEFCRRWGISSEVRRLSIPEDFPRSVLFVTSANGYEIARYDYPSRAEAQPIHSPEYLQRCSQIYFDPLLQRTAGDFAHVTLKFGAELIRFEQDAESVYAQIRDVSDGCIRNIRAKYLVGCDGADSLVRESVGIKLQGDSALSHDVNVFFESNDFAAICPRSKAIMQWILGQEGYVAGIVSVDGISKWRIGIRNIKPGETLTEAAAESFVRRAVGRDFSFCIKSILPWTRRRVVADRYRHRRVFLAGDAVHQLSPTGGFGMNTGICDAIDLSWKLEAFIRGWGGERLLDSYELERRPVGKRVTEEAARNFSALSRIPSGPEIEDDSPEGEALRSLIRDFIYANEYEREYETDGVTFGDRYSESPVICNDGTTEPSYDVTNYHQTARPGHRAPHVWISSGKSTIDFFGRGFTLLSHDRDSPAVTSLRRAMELCGMPLTVVQLKNEMARMAYERRLILVRPDGHVAWRGDNLDVEACALVDRVRGKS